MKQSVSNLNDLTMDRSFLYVFSPSPEDRLYRMQMDQFQERQTALLGHDVVLAEVFEDQQGRVGSEHLPVEGGDGLRRQFHVPSGRFRVMLVDKHAHIKMVADSCVSFEEIVMRVENEHEHVETGI